MTQRGERQRHQRGDPVADRAGRAATPGRPRRRCRRACRRSRSRGSASCRARRRCRAPRRGRASTRPPSPCVSLELAERRGVEVEPLDADPDLVGPQLAAGVEPLGRLRQHDGRRRGPGADRSDRSGGPPWRRVPPWIRTLDRTSCGESLDAPQILLVLWQRWRAHTTERAAAASDPALAGATMTIETARHTDTWRTPASPTPTAASSWSSPTGPASPAGRTSRPPSWASVQWQRAHCVKNVKQLRELIGDLVDERFYADLERDQAERATMSMLVPPQMMNTMVPHATPAGAGSLTEAFYADPIRRYMLPVFSRPAHRLALAPARHPRLAARARHVGRRGAHPPLPDQGAGRAAADLPAVLRPLHPDGPGRQLDPGHRQAEVRRQAERPDRRHARLPAPYAGGARRRGLRRRRGEHAVAAARVVPDRRCSRSRTSATSGWPPRR